MLARKVSARELSAEDMRNLAAAEPGRAATQADGPGVLARVCTELARAASSREQALKLQVQALRMKLNTARQKHQVQTISVSEYFQQLQARDRALGQRREPPAG